MEHTPSDPMQGGADDPRNSASLSEEDRQRLIGLVRRHKNQWSQDRMVLIERCLENLEFFKGNQFLSFNGAGGFVDAVGWMNQNGSRGPHAEDSDDKDLYQYCNNFYQMLATGFVAALSPQTPKSKWEPEDADQLADVTTARAAQSLIDIIERQNGEHSLLKRQLLYFYTTGAAFRHTRYVVDAERAGSKREPVFSETVTEILPARMHCYGCGADAPLREGEAAAQSCPQCGGVLGPDSYFPAERGPVLRQIGEEETPNGMVAQTIYCPLEVDCDPTANSLRETPILNLEVEAHVGALRAAYPDMYDQIASASSGSLSEDGGLGRIARQEVYSQMGASASALTDHRPTLSRTWIQPWAFDLEDDKEFADRMRAAFPKGLLLVNAGDVFLHAREAQLTAEWTWAGTHEGFGLYPPSIGEIVVPFQKRYNDMANILHEFMDRCSSGVTLANADLIDNKALQGKPMLPGVLNLVKMKRTGAPGAMRMADALYQFQFQMHEEAFNYLEQLAYNAQMFAGIPPQVYGGAGDPHVETFGGQQQQLETALGKLNIYWDNLKDEHAQADLLAVRCAQENLTADMRRVIEEKGSEFRNDFVRLGDLQGSVYAYPDTDQGLPVTAAELRQRWMMMLQAAASNPLVQAIFDDPDNQEQAVSALGVPGMVIPGAAMRSKVLQNIEKLLRAQATPVVDPRTGQPTGAMQPSIPPDPEIDDFAVLKQVVRQYCQKNCDIPDNNPLGWQNLLAYYTAAVRLETRSLELQAQRKAMVEQAGQPAAAPAASPEAGQAAAGAESPAEIPQSEIDEVAQTMGKLMRLDPQATGDNIQGQVQAANTLLKMGTALRRDGK